MNGYSETEAGPIVSSMRENARQQIDLTQYPSRFSLRQKVRRTLWAILYLCLFRPSPRIFFGWRRFLLRCCGAIIGRGCAIYPSCKIWAPWNLQMGSHSALADEVDCYCVD